MATTKEIVTDFDKKLTTIEQAIQSIYNIAPIEIIKKYNHLFLFVPRKRGMDKLIHKKFSFDPETNTIISKDKKHNIQLSDKLSTIFSYILKTHLEGKTIYKEDTYFYSYDIPIKTKSTHYEKWKSNRLMYVHMNHINKRLKPLGVKITSLNKRIWILEDIKE